MTTKPLLLITAPWNYNGNMVKTFKAIQITQDSPFNEIIFNPETGHLLVYSTTKHIQPKMMIQLNDHGDALKAKNPRVDRDTPYREQRSLIDDFKLFYIVEQKEIEDFIKMFCFNGEATDSTPAFPWESYMYTSKALREPLTQEIPAEEPKITVEANLHVVE